MSRTFKVLGALVAGVTVVSGVLLALEPGPSLRPSNMAFSAFDAGSSLNGPEAMLFDTAPSHAWQNIIIDRINLSGGQAELDTYYRNAKNQAAGAGYHFVIRRSGEGRIEVCERWRQQNAGVFVHDKNQQIAKQWNANSIGICVMGGNVQAPLDAAQLKEVDWLVRQFMARYGIDASHVYDRAGIYKK